jgi:signal transduction histidine kinase
MVAAFLVYNPLLAAAFAYTFHGTSQFFAHWSVTLTISNVMTLQCFAIVAIAQTGMRRIAQRKLPWLGAVVVSLVSMPITLPIAYRAGGFVANGFERTWSIVGWREYRIGIAFGLVIMSVYFLQGRRAEAREAEIAAKERIHALENAQLKAQVNALRAEMNPHLLFNALNTVAALIHDDPNRAEEVIVELSSLYRGVLLSSRASEHSLRDELKLCEAYLRVEQARFGQRLQTRMLLDPEVDQDAVVPVLLLQPIVENAVKHGVGPRASGGTVTVGAALTGDALHLTITDDGVGMGHSAHRGTGKALDNVRERLALLYGGHATVTIHSTPQTGTIVSLVLPRRAP